MKGKDEEMLMHDERKNTPLGEWWKNPR